MSRTTPLAELAKDLGVDPRTVRRWRATKQMPVRADGSYDPAADARWRLERTSAARRHGRPAAIEPRAGGGIWLARWRQARAQRLRLEVSRLRASLIDVGQVRGLFTTRARGLRRVLAPLGRRLAPALLGKTAREIQAVLDHAARELLERLSEDRDPPRTLGVDTGHVGRRRAEPNARSTT